MLITHDLGVVANMADDVVVMYRGEIMERGTREDIFRRPQHPYLKALMRAVPRFDMKPGERLTPDPRDPCRPAAAAKAAAHGARQADADRPHRAGVTGISKTFTLRSGAVFGKTERISALSNVSLSHPGRGDDRARRANRARARPRCRRSSCAP